MDDVTEIAYERGRRAVATELLRKALDVLGYRGIEGERTKWILERERAVDAFRDSCERYGDNNWSESLDLSDVLQKHLMCYTESKLVIIAELQKIAQDMKGQDNRITENPIFVVQQRRRIYGFDVAWSDNVVWLCEGQEMLDDDPETVDAKRYYREQGDVPDGWSRVGYQDTWVHVQPFFSETAANAYIAANKHNLTDPRVYVESGYRNYEWQALREVFLKLNGEVSDGT